MKQKNKTWSPFQSQEVKEICEHMLESELQQAIKRSRIYGIWCAFTFAGPMAFMIIHGNKVLLAVGLVLIGLHLICFPFWLKSQRRFLCSTQWAKNEGFKPDKLNMFALKK